MVLIAGSWSGSLVHGRYRWSEVRIAGPWSGSLVHGPDRWFMVRIAGPWSGSLVRGLCVDEMSYTSVSSTLEKTNLYIFIPSRKGKSYHPSDT
jgi:hypothetical protein